MDKISLKFEKRELFGKKVKKLRLKGLVPANIFGKKIKSEPISIDEKEFEKVFEKAGETQIIDLAGKPVLVSNIQIHPVTSKLIHVDFRQVDLTEKITAMVPVEIFGESPAEKQNIGTVVQQIDEIEVEALPGDLLEKITVDCSVLVEVDQAVYIKDLRVESKVKVLSDPDLIVVKVEPPQKEEEVVAPVATPAEGEASVDASVEGEQATTDTKSEEKAEESK